MMNISDGTRNELSEKPTEDRSFWKLTQKMDSNLKVRDNAALSDRAHRR